MEQNDYVGQVGSYVSESATLTRTGVAANQEHIDWAFEAGRGSDGIAVGVGQLDAAIFELTGDGSRRIAHHNQGCAQQNRDAAPKQRENVAGCGPRLQHSVSRIGATRGFGVFGQRRTF